MIKRTLMTIGVAAVLLWAATAGQAGRGGGFGGGRGGGFGGGARGGGGFGGGGFGGGARPGGGFSGGARPSGGFSGGARPGGGYGGGARPSGGFGGASRTPSFSSPGAGRPSQLPSSRPGLGGGPSQLPGGRPGGGLSPGLTPGSRPQIGSRPSQLPSTGSRPDLGTRPSQLPSAGTRPGLGNRPPTASLPSTRPDVGGRPGAGGRPGISTLPALGAGAGAGAALGNRLGDRQTALPGLGDRRPGASQLPANRTPQERRDALQSRLNGENRLTGENRPSQLPSRDWDQVRNDWQQNRDEIREDWQQHRDDARNDWQNWFDDHYGWYGGWYGGYAPGYWGRWDYLWDNYPVAAAVGLTWWGVNSLGYWFGYSDYVNPYYTSSMAYDYSQPVITVPVDSAYATSAETAGATSELPPGVSQNALDTFDQARRQFYAGQYDQALQLTDSALREMPRDAVLHEFRSLVLFALQRFSESAAAIHAVLDVGPGWDWKTLSGLYPSNDVYTKQLRALESACESSPDAADLHFLLGYHYLTCGHEEAAIRMFRRASELQPSDKVAAALVASLSPRDATSSPPSAASDAPKPVPSADVIGTWNATGAESSTYSMTLREDGTFTWVFERGVRTQKADGVYTVEGNVLAMEPDSGGTMLAELTMEGSNELHFKMIGGPSDDPGLDFSRSSNP